MLLPASTCLRADSAQSRRHAFQQERDVAHAQQCVVCVAHAPQCVVCVDHWPYLHRLPVVLRRRCMSCWRAVWCWSRMGTRSKVRLHNRLQCHSGGTFRYLRASKHSLPEQQQPDYSCFIRLAVPSGSAQRTQRTQACLAACRVTWQTLQSCTKHLHTFATPSLLTIPIRS